MSLINQMLKDLAKRSKENNNPKMVISDLITLKNAQNKSKNNRYFILGVSLLVVTLIIVSASFFLLKGLDKDELVKNVTSTIDLQNITKTTVDEKNVLPSLSTIKDIQEINDDKGSTLLINFSKPILYRITFFKNDYIVLTLEQSIFDFNQFKRPSNSFFKIVKWKTDDNHNASIILKKETNSKLNAMSLDKLINDQSKLLEPIYQFKLRFEGKIKNNINLLTEKNVSSRMKKPSTGSDKEDTYQSIMETFKQEGDIQLMLSKLKNLVEKYPAFILPRKSLVTFLTKQGDLVQAINIINEGLKLKPFSPDFIQLKAEILLAKGEIKKALKVLDQVLPSLNEYPEFYALKAALYQRNNQPMFAEKLYEELLSLRSDNPLWWIGLGIARESLSKSNDAYLAFSKAINQSDRLSPELKIFLENQMNQRL